MTPKGAAGVPRAVRLDSGEDRAGMGYRRILEFTPSGPRTYLWVGNDDTYDKACFGTIGGKRLERFLIAILKEMRRHPKPRRRRAGR